MWLRTSWITASDELLQLVNLGYALLERLHNHYEVMLHDGMADEETEAEKARVFRGRWMSRVEKRLRAIFPTAREVHVLRRHGRKPIPDNGELYFRFFAEVQRVDLLLERLEQIRLLDLRQYVGVPPTKDRLFVEAIDSFAKVREVNPNMVADVLKNGRIALLEDFVQRAIERILEIPFRRLDHGGETNDLYTSNLMVNGQRIPTAFVLKGRGCDATELRIKDCGKNGDQLVRLFNSPAELFVVQYVGPVGDAVIDDLTSKVAARRAAGKPAWFAVIDGQDTARLLKAYGVELPNLDLGRSPRKKTTGTSRRSSK